jgi:hypothetical protein
VLAHQENLGHPPFCASHYSAGYICDHEYCPQENSKNRANERFLPDRSLVQTWQYLTPEHMPKTGEKTGSNGLVQWLVTSLLTTVAGELRAMPPVSHHADPLSPKNLKIWDTHPSEPAITRLAIFTITKKSKKSGTPTFLSQPLLGWLSLQS